MSHTTEVLLGLFIVYIAAQVGAEIAQRLRLPAVVGEIAAGTAIGPSVFGWITVSEPLAVLADIGAILLLFSVGLETHADDLKRVGRVATMVAVLGVLLPFALGGLWAIGVGYPTAQAAFVAAAFVATSAGITARVLHDIGVLDRTESRVILGAAVIDDILAMLLLGMVTSLQADNGLNVLNLLLVLAQAVAFVFVITLVGTRIMRRTSPLLEVPINPLSPLTISLTICLGLAVAALHFGLAAIIGAFLAGMIVAETEQRETLVAQLRPIMALLVPFFFVVTGARIYLAELSTASALGALLVVTMLAIVGKLVGCGAGAWSLGRKSALIVGVGMVPRGEVGIIVASLGLQANVFSNTVYAIIIAMSLLTSVIVPPALSFLFAGERTPASPATSVSERERGYS